MIRRPPRSTLFPYTTALPIFHLEVAGVQHRAGGGADGDGERVGDGVVHRHELALERPEPLDLVLGDGERVRDRKSTRLNSSHANISYAVFCLKKKKKHNTRYI